MDGLISMVVIGAGATAMTDAWALLRRRLFHVPLPDYALVGRWFGHMAHRRVRHASIKAAAAMRGERALGWAAHYVIGIAFAGVLLLVAGPDWAHAPTLAPALLTGIGSVAAPYFLMQPAMGLGLAARRAPRPNAARLQSLATHAVFGLGLYAAAVAACFVITS